MLSLGVDHSLAQNRNKQDACTHALHKYADWCLSRSKVHFAKVEQGPKADARHDDDDHRPRTSEHIRDKCIAGRVRMARH